MNLDANTSLSDFLNCEYHCSCGRTHTTSLKHVDISENAYYNLPCLLKKNNYAKLYIITDCNTYNVCGKEVIHILNDNLFDIYEHRFDTLNLIPNEEAIDALLSSIPDDTELIIGIGTGTICDLGKYISYKLELPFYIVATAPSMDGFASNVSCLIINGMKTTIPTHIPEAVIADINTLKASPRKMIAAGIGDILGKYICLLDWKIASIITDEYYCSYVESLVRSSIQTVISSISNIEQLESDAVKYIMDGLVLSGIAMSYVGNSRPASGSEHHLSHFWELNFMVRNKPPVLHGIKVGIGTLETVRLYNKLLDVVDNESGFPDFAQAEQMLLSFSYEKWINDINKAYGPLADEVINLEEEVHKNSYDNAIKRLSVIKKRWPDIYVTIKAYLPNIDDLVSMLKLIGAPTRPLEEGIEPWLVSDSILYAKELRNRYGLLQLLFDLGYLYSFADEVLHL